jgi:hypothetical protein
MALMTVLDEGNGCVSAPNTSPLSPLTVRDCLA